MVVAVAWQLLDCSDSTLPGVQPSDFVDSSFGSVHGSPNTVDELDDAEYEPDDDPTEPDRCCSSRNDEPEQSSSCYATITTTSFPSVKAGRIHEDPSTYVLQLLRAVGR